MRPLTQVQCDVLIFALDHSNTITPREARANIEELDRRVTERTKRFAEQGYANVNDNTPVWNVMRQLEQKGMVERLDGEWCRNSSGYREWSRIFRLTERGQRQAEVIKRYPAGVVA